MKIIDPKDYTANESARQTGRTTRMLLEAMAMATERSTSVLVIGLDEAHLKRLLDRVMQLANERRLWHKREAPSLRIELPTGSVEFASVSMGRGMQLLIPLHRMFMDHTIHKSSW